MKHRSPNAQATSIAWAKNNPERAKDTRTRTNYNRKVRVMTLYGGKCACCGYSVLDSLTIDHIDGGGRAERKEAKDGRNRYKKMEEAFGTNTFQVLCMNCNHSKHANGGVCAHQGGRPSDDVTSTSKRQRKLRLDAIAGLGGICHCCEESNVSFLTIDHVGSDGASHRLEKGYYGSLRDVIDSGFDPKKYQVLCFNCNINKQISGTGSCLCKSARVIPPAPTRKLIDISVVSPDGELVHVVNLTKFCKERGLSVTNFHTMVRGKAKSVKGWTMAPPDMTAVML